MFPISVMVPIGPLWGMRAESPEIVRLIGAPAFGLLFTLAISTGVEELGIYVSTAASALNIEKGQNALARFGTEAAANVMITDPVMSRAHRSSTLYISSPVSCGIELEVFWCEAIRKQGNSGVSAHTKMAYIQRI